MSRRERLEVLRYILGEDLFDRMVVVSTRQGDDFETYVEACVRDCVEASEDAARPIESLK